MYPDTVPGHFFDRSIEHTRAECQRRLTVRHSHLPSATGAHGGLEQVRRPLTGHEGARPNTPAIALEPPPKDPFRTPPINVSGRARAIVCCRSSARVEQRARPLFVFDRSNVPRIALPLTRRSDPLHYLLFVLVVRLSAGAGAQTLLTAFARRRVDRAGRGDALAHARRRRAARAWVALAAAPQPGHRAPRLSSPRPPLSSRHRSSSSSRVFSSVAAPC